ncbi:MAG: PEP-CTERM sorting domain-containing protein [Phycisphaerae bacterium]|nr:PEP-CTERM sorting domain-containing protein [Phycisphaerae bacterium]HPP22366.1 PEP-CTERM sorting domain-containing protein [Phycisphaerae bacterium]
MRSLMLSLACLAVLAGPAALATPPASSSFTPIGVLNPATPYSEVRAISPDGQFVVGGSRATTGLTAPFLWTGAGSMQALPSPGNMSAWANGVDVRPAVNEIVIAAQVGSSGQRYNAPLGGSGPLSGTWTSLLPAGDCWIDGYNTLATHTSGDKYYIAGSSPNNCAAALYRYRGSSTQDDYWGMSSRLGGLTSAASTGACVGFDYGGTYADTRPIYVVPPSGAVVIPSLSPERTGGMGLGISNNAQYATGYAYANSTDTHAFRWLVDSPTADHLLPFSGDIWSAGLDVADGGTVVGWTYGQSTGQRAVLWDTTGLWGSTSGAILVQDRLAALGLDVSQWAVLTEVVAISADGLTIAGNGIWAADGSIRGWVATIPEPTAGLLILLGGSLAGACRRRRPAVGIVAG